MSVSLASSFEYVDVKTSKGIVRGKRFTVNGTQVDQFAGIPYARPPVGRLRFARPVEPREWSPEILDTTNYEPVYCWDITHNNTSEDCLYLSVWTPVRDTNSPLLPVFVFLFPGAFTIMAGDYDDYNASYAVRNDVIVVFPNFRTNIFSYFHGNRSDATGNLGEWDQAMAFKWVADNIRAFGGDPGQVTISGVSSSGAQALIHLVSPVSQHYFRRALVMSATMPGYDKNYIIAKSKQAAAMLNCTKADYTPCMRRRKADILTLVASENFVVEFRPYVGDDIFPKNIMPALRQGRFNKDVPLLTGGHPLEYATTAIQECDMVLEYTEQSNYTLTRDNVRQCFNMAFKHPAHLADNAADHYLKGVDESDRKALRLVTSRAIGHYLFTCPTYFVSSTIAKQNGSSDVYSYLLPYGTKQTAPYCVDKVWPRPCHGDEWHSITELMRMWSSFAKTGQPAKKDSPYWPAYQDAPVAPIAPTNLGTGERPIWPSYQVISPLDATKTPVYKPYKDCDEFWSKYISIYDDVSIKQPK
ncbi:Acetylcholinesterase [Halotydeus destructor]|nr:Acetylcholinesterase [Halotydeus destructor]